MHIKDLRTLAMGIEALVLDNDGVLTDNTELIGFEDGTVLKRRSHYDGQGISFLRAIGIKIAILTGDSGKGAVAIEQLVNKWNSLPSAVSGDWSKVHLVTGIMGEAKLRALNNWLTSESIPPIYCAVMGDDYVDLPMLSMAGFRAAPVTAEKGIIDLAHFVSNRPAGQGAVRDFANFILEARDIHPSTLATS